MSLIIRILLHLSLCSMVIVFVSCERNDIGSPVTINIDFPALYAINSSGKSISVINLNKQAFEISIPLEDGGLFPCQPTVSPDNKSIAIAMREQAWGEPMVLNNATKTNAVLVIDAKTCQTQKTIQISGSPLKALYSPTKPELWVAVLTSQATSEIQVFNTDTWVKINEIELGGILTDLCLSKNKQNLYAIGVQPARFYSIDLNTWSIETSGNLSIDFPKSIQTAFWDEAIITGQSEATLIRPTDGYTYNSKYLGSTTGYSAISPGGILWIPYSSWIDRTTPGFNSWTDQNNLYMSGNVHSIVFSSKTDRFYASIPSLNSVYSGDVNNTSTESKTGAGSNPTGLVLIE